MGKGKKIALGLLGTAAVIAVGYFVVKNARITRQTNLAEARGFKCGRCQPSGVKRCVNSAGNYINVKCGFRL